MGPLAGKDTVSAPPPRIHLILKDGSFQLVTSYQRLLERTFSIVSAERNGAEEVVPLALVDLDATHRWEQRHTTAADGSQQPPPIDPELLKEESDRAALTPEVAQDLRLPLQGGVLALDTYQGGAGAGAAAAEWGRTEPHHRP